MKIIVNGEVAQIPAVGGGADSSIPSGGIIMWSGSTVPDGWALCNGENGTPDLRGRFVLGVSDTHAMGETGGSENVTLTVEQMPKHTHDFQENFGYVNSGGYTGIYFQKINTNYFIESKMAGGDQPHPNMPPYYTLAYIMKL